METIHKLPFEAMPWKPAMLQFMPELLRSALKIDSAIVAFRVGTCHGIYTAKPNAYQIIAINNECPGNGHFEDVLQWFEASCRRDNKSLMFVEIMNDKFGEHLKVKRGFKIKGKNAMKRY